MIYNDDKGKIYIDKNTIYFEGEIRIFDNHYENIILDSIKKDVEIYKDVVIDFSKVKYFNSLAIKILLVLIRENIIKKLTVKLEVIINTNNKHQMEIYNFIHDYFERNEISKNLKLNRK